MHTSLKDLSMVSNGKLGSNSIFTAGAQTVEKLPIITLTTMCAFVQL